MKKNSLSLKKIIYSCFGLFLIIAMIASLTAEAYSFVPLPPTGSTTGEKDVEYEFKVMTIEVGSSWMFDWGDGTHSDWIVLEESDPYISQSHSWNENGDYQVKVKYKSTYSYESSWSSPLAVTIEPPTDIDGDGFSNELEVSFGTDPEDANDFPIDTDNDGYFDEDSLDGDYIGDYDDDADGLLDTIEISLGSNSKNNNDVESIFLENQLFYIVDTNNDGLGNILYNVQDDSSNKIKKQDSSLYLDIDDNGAWDYKYSNGELFEYTPFPWLQVIIGAAGVILIILAILFGSGLLYVYEEEVVVE